MFIFSEHFSLFCSKIEGIIYGADVASRFRRDPRQLDEDEEAWFDEEEEFTVTPTVPPVDNSNTTTTPPLTSSPKNNIPPITSISPIAPITTTSPSAPPTSPTSTPSLAPFSAVAVSSYSPRPLGVRPKYQQVLLHNKGSPTLPDKPTLTAVSQQVGGKSFTIGIFE